MATDRETRDRDILATTEGGVTDYTLHEDILVRLLRSYYFSHPS